MKIMFNEKQGNLIFLSMMTSNISVYVVPVWNSTELVITLSPMVMEAEGSNILMVIQNLRYFTGRFTVLYDSEVPNSTVTGIL